MFQGTTPTHKFMTDISTDLISKVRIIYEQNGKVVLTKHKEDCTLEGRTITTKLTQEDTLKFATGSARVQLHVRVTNGDAFTNKPITVPVYILLDKAVI